MLEWCKACCHRTLEQWKRSGSPMDESGFDGCQEELPVQMHSANFNVWWRRNNGLGLFFMVRARPFSSSEGKYYCYTIKITF